jgi:hypothetical protein
MSYLAFKRLTALILVLGLVLAVTPAWAGEFVRDPSERGSSGYIPPVSRFGDGGSSGDPNGDPDGPSVDLPNDPDATGYQVVGKVDPAESSFSGSSGLWSVWRQWITGLLQQIGVR